MNLSMKALDEAGNTAIREFSLQASTDTTSPRVSVDTDRIVNAPIAEFSINATALLTCGLSVGSTTRTFTCRPWDRYHLHVPLNNTSDSTPWNLSCNGSFIGGGDIILDQSPPLSTFTVTKGDEQEGWYDAAVDAMITMDREEKHPRGIEVDGALSEGQNVTLHIPHSKVITYRSVDSAGNLEELHQREIRIDTEPPIIQSIGTVPIVPHPSESFRIKVRGYDMTSGIARAYVSDGAGRTNLSREEQEYTGTMAAPDHEGDITLNITLIDNAGNTASRQASVNVRAGMPLVSLDVMNNSILASDTPIHPNVSGGDDAEVSFAGETVYLGDQETIHITGDEGEHTLRWSISKGEQSIEGSYTIRLDTSKPVLTMHRSEGAGSTTYVTNATDSMGIAGLKLFVDGDLYRASSRPSERFVIPSESFETGIHAIRIEAEDRSGQTTTYHDSLIIDGSVNISGTVDGYGRYHGEGYMPVREILDLRGETVSIQYRRDNITHPLLTRVIGVADIQAESTWKSRMAIELPVSNVNRTMAPLLFYHNKSRLEPIDTSTILRDGIRFRRYILETSAFSPFYWGYNASSGTGRNVSDDISHPDDDPDDDGEGREGGSGSGTSGRPDRIRTTNDTLDDRGMQTSRTTHAGMDQDDEEAVYEEGTYIWKGKGQGHMDILTEEGMVVGRVKMRFQHIPEDVTLLIDEAEAIGDREHMNVSASFGFRIDVKPYSPLFLNISLSREALTGKGFDMDGGKGEMEVYKISEEWQHVPFVIREDGISVFSRTTGTFRVVGLEASSPSVSATGMVSADTSRGTMLEKTSEETAGINRFLTWGLSQIVIVSLLGGILLVGGSGLAMHRRRRNVRAIRRLVRRGPQDSVRKHMQELMGYYAILSTAEKREVYREVAQHYHQIRDTAEHNGKEAR